MIKKLRSDEINTTMAMKMFENVMAILFDVCERIFVRVMKLKIEKISSTKITIKINCEKFVFGDILNINDSSEDTMKRLKNVYNNHMLFLKYLKLQIL
jgi:hypothetical protein